MKVLLLSRYGQLGASSRVRFLQYLPYFQSQGAEVSISPLFSDSYLRALYSGGARYREALLGYVKRALAIFRARNFDVIIIEKEIFPFFPALAERFLKYIGIPFVVDYDDALFHRYDCHSNFLIRRLLGGKIDTVMRQATTVIAGNSYLSDRACRSGASHVELVPTVVDLERYHPKVGAANTTMIVGWIGTPQTSRYLMPLLPIFESIKEEISVRFVAVGANPEDFAGTPVEAWPWSEESEVASIQKFDVGIMPLKDSPWERGKCGYKLIQYMACGVPVVASPVGVNCEIVEHQGNGLLVDSTEKWDQALRQLLQSEPSLRKRMGEAGRVLVARNYSVQSQAQRLFTVIAEAAGN